LSGYCDLISVLLGLRYLTP